jgi:hypothetical protein
MRHVVEDCLLGSAFCIAFNSFSNYCVHHPGNCGSLARLAARLHAKARAASSAAQGNLERNGPRGGMPQIAHTTLRSYRSP